MRFAALALTRTGSFVAVSIGNFQLTFEPLNIHTIALYLGSLRQASIPRFG